MQTKFETVKKNIFTKNETNLCTKTYHIKADDIVFCTKFKRKKLDFNISVELYGWSNKYQKHTPILLSSWAYDLDEGKQLQAIIQKYSPLAKKFITYLKNLKYLWNYKELFYQFDHPNILYHYKLHNTFSLQELEKIIKPSNLKTPILNIPYLQSNPLRINYNELFLPHYITGCYFCAGGICSTGIEISVDLDESDFATIETDEGKISKDQLLEMLYIS